MVTIFPDTGISRVLPPGILTENAVMGDTSKSLPLTQMKAIECVIFCSLLPDMKVTESITAKNTDANSRNWNVPSWKWVSVHWT